MLQVLEDTTDQLVALLKGLIREGLVSNRSFIVFVDDGSKDSTWKMIEEQSLKIPYITGVKLAANAGHQNAFLAGLNSVIDRCDCSVSLDADLQDDPAVIRDFVLNYREGSDVVYRVRNSRETDTIFKRSTAKAFYKLMIKMGINIVNDHADFRLMSNTTLKNLSEFKEVNLFLSGLVPLVGLKSTKVYYKRQERMVGESKYPLKKMLAFSLDEITSFSITPIRLVTLMGITISLLSILAGVYALFSKLFGVTVSGWTSIILSIWFLGGIQLISLGLIGEYIGKIYKETKHSPKYFIEQKIGLEQEEKIIL